MAVDYPSALHTALEAVSAAKGRIAELERDIANNNRVEVARSENRQRQHSSTIAADTADQHRKWEIAAQHQEIFDLHGMEVPRPKADEPASGYERRLLTNLQRYTKDKDLAGDLYELNDYYVERLGRQIRQDAMDPESRKTDIPDGQIKEIVRRDPITGRMTHEFISSNPRTTFIHAISAINPRRVLAASSAFTNWGDLLTRCSHQSAPVAKVGMKAGRTRPLPPVPCEEV